LFCSVDISNLFGEVDCPKYEPAYGDGRLVITIATIINVIPFAFVPLKQARPGAQEVLASVADGAPGRHPISTVTCARTVFA
jgi:hypothetical protein